MKIYISYANDEESELDRVVEALLDVMPNYFITRLADSKNHKGKGTHSTYYIHNMRHPEI